MIGDADNIAARLRRYLPRWFGITGNPTPVLDALLAGLAVPFALAYELYVFAVAQSRLATATGGWLDLAAFDFFGFNFGRLHGEGDDGFRRRLREEVLRDRNTRGAIDAAVFDISGEHPHVFEGFHAPTCGGWGTPGFAFGAAGRWGSRRAPWQVIITTPLPQNYGIPNRGGWGSGTGGWGFGNFSFVDDADIQGRGATQGDILAAIERVRTAGIEYFVRFLPPVGTGTP